MAAQFPTRPNASFPGEPAGPHHLKLRDLSIETSATFKEFKDKGRSYGMPNPAITLRWELVYDGLTAAEAAVLDAHLADAQGIFEGFSFRHPRTNVLYTDVHYEEYESDHTKVYSQSRRLVLIKTPA